VNSAFAVVNVAGGPFAGTGLADVDVSTGDAFGTDFAAVFCTVVKLFGHLSRIETRVKTWYLAKALLFYSYS
jgi:hypothetical protein